MGEKKKIIVGIGEFKVAKAPAELITFNLGSCVGVALYDIMHNIGGLAHVALPCSAVMEGSHQPDSRFADVALSLMIKKMEEMGAKRSFMVAKIAGGADMFGLSPDTPSQFDIGRQNVESVKKYLQGVGIMIVAEETLGNIPRTMEFDLTTGKVMLKTSQMETRYL
ncbi:chemotaxis protein CheD [Candidatus Aerophobetes bacterium]|nr:chemotaxis protein CheD [Candidatus Aerophobetes bacterium]